jgi:hypothetical protein
MKQVKSNNKVKESIDQTIKNFKKGKYEEFKKGSLTND